MRGATHAKWAALATAVALAATACGGGDDSGGGGGADGIVSSSWGDPQNPLEPANTNEVQGGKVLSMIFRVSSSTTRRPARPRTCSPRRSRPPTR